MTSPMLHSFARPQVRQEIAALYDRYCRLTYSVIFKIVQNPAVAEELMQETFLRVWSRADIYDQQKGMFVQWILTIAKNQAIDYLRSRSRGEVACDPSQLGQVAILLSFNREYVIREEAIDIRNIVATLPTHLRTLIELSYYDGFSHAEIAKKLDQPLGTVKTRVRQALKTIEAEIVSQPKGMPFPRHQSGAADWQSSQAVS